MERGCQAVNEWMYEYINRLFELNFQFCFPYISLKHFLRGLLENILSSVNDEGIVCDESDNQCGRSTGAQSHIRAKGLQLEKLGRGVGRGSRELVSVY